MISGKDTAEHLGTDPEKGLDGKKAAENAARYGTNTFTREKPVSVARRIADSCREPMIILLFIAAAITLAVSILKDITGSDPEYYECAGIFIAIFISVFISVFMESRSSKAFEELSKMNSDSTVKVLRNGAAARIPISEVVTGDIVFVSAGDRIPADGRLLSCSLLTCDESSLTGESEHVSKSADAVFTDEKTPVAERTNMLYSGCYVTGGSGMYIVTAVGDSTEFGRIAAALRTVENTSTPLQEKLARLGKILALTGAVCAAAVFAIQIIEICMADAATFDTVTEAFITSIVLLVAAVPEGLPAIVALSLSLNIIKMSRENALVRKMIACETVGCVNVICSDKTGTLTENRMTVTDIYTGGRVIRPAELDDTVLAYNFCLNSTADISSADGKKTFIGNPTECALLFACMESGTDYRELRGNAEIICSYPFSSDTKYMTTVVRHEDSVTVYVKGSPEKVAALCSCGLTDKAEKLIEKFQKQSRRIIAFAHREIDHCSSTERSDIETGLIYDGFVAITDPLRADVAGAVRDCRRAGIGIKMLTGDNIVTASAIAGELNLLDGSGIALEAKDIEAMSDEELLERLPDIRVIARSTPGVKMRVVKLLKKAGNVVAVTGDGINDAPALKNADVGIAMGIAGTDVSKEASDIVLLDDAFSTIARAVRWGRGVYDNFRRFIQFQLTVNVSSMLVIILSLLAGLASPFTAVQLLWINIIMDGPPAITLGLEPVRDNLMERKPVPRSASLLSGGIMPRIFVIGIYITAVFMLQYCFNFLGCADSQMMTVLFSLFAVFQLMNSLNCREMSNTSMFRNFFGNRAFFTAFGITFALQILITQFGGNFFSTVPLSAELWLKIILTALSVLGVSELMRLIGYLKDKRK